MVKMELGFGVWVIILLKLGICGLARNSSLGCVERERTALLSFRATLVDPSHLFKYLSSRNVTRLSSWNSNNRDCCSWEGVTCHKTTGHVISLDLTLGNMYYSDRVVAERVDSSLLELKHLTYLDLSFIIFTYTKFPAYLGSLKQLQYLNLSGTYFSGVVPQNLGNLSSLHTLDLRGGYSLEVHDLMWVSRLSSLEHLDLSGVNLSMTNHVFEVLNSLPSLKFLSLAYSDLDNTHLIVSSLNDSTFLANVKHLDLSQNSFQGEFLCFLKNLSTHNLESLSLGYNFFSGELPQELGEFHHLKNLDLHHNLLHGRSPTSLGKLSALTSLDISSNNFSGSLPSWLANLTSLRVLDLRDNQLSGEIPISLGELSNLESIDISFNWFETTLSEAHFAKLSKLEEFRVGYNMIRFGVGYDWVPPFQLKRLTLRSTKMGGQFPEWLQTQKALRKLDLANCSMTGRLPAWLHSMNALYTLDVSRNNISGPIPELPSSLGVIQLSDNMITHLPSNIGHMIPHVMYLNLARNLINGSVPDSLCQMEELLVLDLSKNHFSGNLPNCSLSSLREVSLSYNQLTGIIPNSIKGANYLFRLHLNDNKLTGQLPSTLKNCTRLEFLDVGGNNLSGELPKWIGKELLQLKFLRLRNNDFSGAIPGELCQLSQLQLMDLANNNLIGNIPHCFANFSSMRIKHINEDMGVVYGEDNIMLSDSDSLSQVMKGAEREYTTNYEYVVNLDLSRNHLVGHIPWELTNLSGLLGLNLSHNHLEGQIPAKIGDLKSLESLDLSNNHLVGEIPESLSNLNFLNHLNLSNNNLSGQIPGGRQLQTLEDPSIYQGNPLLCGPPLQRKCDEPDVQNHEEEDEDRADKIWLYGIIIAGFATGFWVVIGGMVVKTKWRQAYFIYIEAAMVKMLGY